MNKKTLHIVCVCALQKRGGHQGDWRRDQEGKACCWRGCPGHAIHKARKVFQHDDSQWGAAAGLYVVYMSRMTCVMFAWHCSDDALFNKSCFMSLFCRNSLFSRRSWTFSSPGRRTTKQWVGLQGGVESKVHRHYSHNSIIHFSQFNSCDMIVPAKIWRY